MSQISKIIAKHIGPGDNPEMRERLEELERSSIFRLYRGRLQLELNRVRKQNDDERDPIVMYRNQGAIGKLNLALDLPTRMYKEAGGKRELFTGEVPVAEAKAGNYVAPPPLSELFPDEVKTERNQPLAVGLASFQRLSQDTRSVGYFCKQHGPFSVPFDSFNGNPPPPMVVCRECAAAIGTKI